MKNVKVIIALLLSLVLVCGLVSCGSGSSDKDKDEEIAVEGVKEEKPADEEIEDADKPADTENLGDVEDLIVGEWVATIDVTELFTTVLLEKLDAEEASEYFEFKNLNMYFSLKFDGDNGLTLAMSTGETVDKIVEGVLNGMDGYLQATSDMTLEEALAESGMDEDAYIEEIITTLGLEDVIFEEDCSYEIDGDGFYVDDEVFDYEFSDEDTLEISTTDVGLEDYTTDKYVTFERQ